MNVVVVLAKMGGTIKEIHSFSGEDYSCAYEKAWRFFQQKQRERNPNDPDYCCPSNTEHHG